ncbi:Sodium/hydrogen exchanger family-domain-containing protein [Spinellus fusiger]|nr:Sodium/hydrogen exchanger family-domain-containing protein [Spinellus fusiger]
MSTAVPQAGVFAGLNPSQFNASDPVVLFIIQCTIILVFCRLLAIPLGWLKQPKVIAEVIAGIVLGPSVMGRIPGFQETVFPTASLPFINLISTLGLIFFLFQVGLEVDMRVVKRDWKKSLAISVAGMALPFGLGIAASVGLYKLQNEPSVPFSSFLLFLGVAMSITAFPVLARILVELKLLRTKVGSLTMSSGLLNDCTAWVLLALVVALLNSSGGLDALWVFLTTIAYALFLIFLIGPLYRKLCIHTGAFENGPSPLLMTVTLMIVLVSAFVTDIIGVHAIFGGFLAGIIVPHDGDLSVKVTEKIEDIVNIIFLPLYFTLSGLKTQIGLLDSGIVWGYVILVIFLACFGKIVGCTVAARLCGMTMRESFAVGFLMNCKGLVELIVLNIGHDAGVLNDQVFVIMVVMALITTFMTTPAVLWLYPEWYQKQTSGENMDRSNQFTITKELSIMETTMQNSRSRQYRIATMLNSIDMVPNVVSILRLFVGAEQTTEKSQNESVDIYALRLLELTQRPSDVMRSHDLRETERYDPILSVMRTFGSIIGIDNVHTRLDICPLSDYVKTVADYSHQSDADIILLPISMHRNHHHHHHHDHPPSSPTEMTSAEKSNLLHYDTEFVTKAFEITKVSVSIFIDRGLNDLVNRSSLDDFQILVPFTGGVDDCAAVLLALRLQTHRPTAVTILHLGTATSVIRFATKESIYQCLDSMSASSDERLLLDTLFSGEKNSSTSVVYRTIRDVTVSSMLTSLEKPLKMQDLVVLGRNVVDRHTGPLVHSVLGQESETRDTKQSLGSIASDLLSLDVMASLVVVQAPIEGPISFSVNA